MKVRFSDAFPASHWINQRQRMQKYNCCCSSHVSDMAFKFSPLSNYLISTLRKMAARVSFSLLRHSEIHKTQSSLRWYNLISQHNFLESSSEFLNRVNIVREKIEVVEDVCASPAQPLKELTHEFLPRLRWTKLFEMNPLWVKTTE